MFFNLPDTLGTYLSFRNVCGKNSVTPYASVIANTNLYETDRTHGDKLPVLKTPKFNYFYIRCPELSTGIESYRNTGPVDHVFAKIRWFYNEFNNIVFDSFVPTKKIFYSPIDVLRELHMSIVHPDGRLVEFNGLNHSFTIKIVEVFGQPTQTDISARINAEILPRRV